MKLSKEAQRIFDEIADSYGINDPGGRIILNEACKAFDVMQMAQKEIDKHGLVAVGRYKQVKANPATAVLRDARSQFIQFMKLLRLDINYEDYK